jgi:hypothetical protein
VAPARRIVFLFDVDGTITKSAEEGANNVRRGFYPPYNQPPSLGNTEKPPFTNAEKEALFYEGALETIIKLKEAHPNQDIQIDVGLATESTDTGFAPLVQHALIHSNVNLDFIVTMDDVAKSRMVPVVDVAKWKGYLVKAGAESALDYGFKLEDLFQIYNPAHCQTGISVDKYMGGFANFHAQFCLESGKRANAGMARIAFNKMGILENEYKNLEVVVIGDSGSDFALAAHIRNEICPNVSAIYFSPNGVEQTNMSYIMPVKQCSTHAEIARHIEDSIMNNQNISVSQSESLSNAERPPTEVVETGNPRRSSRLKKKNPDVGDALQVSGGVRKQKPQQKPKHLKSSGEGVIDKGKGR